MNGGTRRVGGAGWSVGSRQAVGGAYLPRHHLPPAAHTSHYLCTCTHVSLSRRRRAVHIPLRRREQTVWRGGRYIITLHIVVANVMTSSTSSSVSTSARQPRTRMARDSGNANI